MEDQKELVQTAIWIQDVVMGLNLCPFAHAVYKQDKIRYTLANVNTSEDIISIFEKEITHLLDHENISTTFIVIPLYSDFLEYLDCVDLLNQFLQTSLHGEHFQIASFHPDYIFAGSTDQDPANYTNRSPFPMIHILREAELTDGINVYPNTEDIPKNNIKLLRKMGLEEIQKILNNSKNQ